MYGKMVINVGEVPSVGESHPSYLSCCVCSMVNYNHKNTVHSQICHIIAVTYTNLIHFNVLRLLGLHRERDIRF